jgi:hypothetical protein
MFDFHVDLLLDIGAPVMIARIKPGRFPLVLRNLHLSAVVVNFSTIFLVSTLIPLETILHGENILSILAEVVTHFLYPIIIDLMDDRYLGDGCEFGSLLMRLLYYAVESSLVCVVDISQVCYLMLSYVTSRRYCQRE